MFLIFPPRFMTTSAASCAPSMKMTAFLINLSVCGTGRTGKKHSGWEPFPWVNFGQFTWNMGYIQMEIDVGPQDLARMHYVGHWLESVITPVKRRMLWGPEFISGLAQLTVQCQEENAVLNIQGTQKLGPNAYSRLLVIHQQVLWVLSSGFLDLSPWSC